MNFAASLIACRLIFHECCSSNSEAVEWVSCLAAEKDACCSSRKVRRFWRSLSNRGISSLSCSRAFSACLIGEVSTGSAYTVLNFD